MPTTSTASTNSRPGGGPQPKPGLPTARGFLPAGTPGADCTAYNRSCKVTRLIVAARAQGLGPSLADEDIDALADTVGVRRPGGRETRAAVRAGLADPVQEGSAAAPQILEALAEAAQEGLPFTYRTSDGQSVLFLPVPLR